MGTTGNDPTDAALLWQFVTDRSEAAFRRLTERHVDLVFGTAVRRTGDRTGAEEIAQNVFIALGHKAAWLQSETSLAAWLHRTTVLEARQWWRGEMRRRQREQTAVELETTMKTAVETEPALSGALDEALLELREGERQAVLLRFFEGQNHREIGAALGIGEDAARKRVDKALEQLLASFRKRGLAMGSTAAVAASLAAAAQAAPVGLAASAVQATLAAGATVTGINLVLFHVMSLTKTQTTLACLLAAAVPLTWQWQAGARLAREQTAANARLMQANGRADEGERHVEGLRTGLREMQSATAEAEWRRDLLTARRLGQAPVPHYQWDDNSPLVRVPKEMVAQLDVSAMANQRGVLSEQIKELLQMTGAETAAVQAAMNRFVAAYDSLRASSVRRVEPNEQDKRWRPAEEVRVFELPDVTEQFKELRAALFAEITGALGDERAALFRKKLDYWMPIDDEYHGLSSMAAVFPFAHRVRFHPCTYGFPALGWGISKANGEGMSASISIEEIPAYLRPELQDWIAEAQTRPPLMQN